MFKKINEFILIHRQKKYQAFLILFEKNFERYTKVSLFWAASSVLQEKYGEKYYSKLSGWILENDFGMALTSIPTLEKMSEKSKEHTGDKEWMLHYYSAMLIIYRKWSEKYGIIDIFEKLIEDSTKLCQADLEKGSAE